MKTLSDVILIKDKIVNFAEKLGFKNVRVFYSGLNNPPQQKLELIVEKIPGKTISYKNSTYLSVILSEEIGCEVSVTPCENIENIYKDYFNTNSASLNEEKEISSLFKLPTEKIQFKLPTEDAGSKKIRDAVLKEARDAIAKSSSEYSPNTFTFLSSTSSTDTKNSKTYNFAEYGEKAFSENFNSEESITQENITKFLEGFIKSASEKGYNKNLILKSIDESNLKCQ